MTSLILISVLAPIATAIAVVPVTVILRQDARRARLEAATPSWTEDNAWRTGQRADTTAVLV